MLFIFIAPIKVISPTTVTFTVFAVIAVYSHTEADVNSQCLLEANVSTEVCLTVLDTLSIFIMGFKVLTVTAC